MPPTSSDLARQARDEVAWDRTVAAERERVAAAATASAGLGMVSVDGGDIPDLTVLFENKLVGPAEVV
jgi:hypothetical protein